MKSLDHPFWYPLRRSRWSAFRLQLILDTMLRLLGGVYLRMVQVFKYYPWVISLTVRQDLPIAKRRHVGFELMRADPDCDLDEFSVYVHNELLRLEALYDVRKSHSARKVVPWNALACSRFLVRRVVDGINRRHRQPELAGRISI